MSEELYREDFVLAGVLFLIALGVFVLGYTNYLWPTGNPMLDYSWVGTLLVSGTSAFFSLVFAIKAVLK